MAAKKSIVIVDDEQDLRMILSRALESTYEVETVSTGDSALGVIQARLPDLVILDVHMPHLNGLEICEQIRSRLQTSRLPVLFLSGHLDPWTLERAKRAGGSDFLAKPFELSELLLKVRRLTGEDGS